MDDRTQRIAAALADVPPTLLQTLVETAHEVSDQAPGLLAWLDHAATWELDRREGRTYLLQEPLAAIDDSEVPLGLDALAALSDQLGQRIHAYGGRSRLFADIHSDGVRIDFPSTTTSALSGPMVAPLRDLLREDGQDYANQARLYQRIASDGR